MQLFFLIKAKLSFGSVGETYHRNFGAKSEIGFLKVRNNHLIVNYCSAQIFSNSSFEIFPFFILLNILSSYYKSSHSFSSISLFFLFFAVLCSFAFSNFYLSDTSLFSSLSFFISSLFRSLFFLLTYFCKDLFLSM